MGSKIGEKAPRSPKRRKTDEDMALSAARPSSSADPMIPHTTAANTIDIDTSGDVIFHLNNSTAIRVHSVTLRLISKPFTAMFGPHFSEGQNLTPTQPKAIPFPEDDPAALTFLCRVAHRRHVSGADFTDPPHFDLFISLAALIQKYDCISGLSLELASWFDSHLQRVISEAASTTPQVTSSQLGGLLAIAAHLNSPRAFRASSRALMLHHTGSFWKLLHMLTVDECNMIPERTVVALTERAALTKRHMFTVISERHRDILVMGVGDDLRNNVLKDPRGPSLECMRGKDCSLLTAALLVVDDIMPPEELSLKQWPKYYMRQDLSGFEEKYREKISQLDVCDECDFKYTDIGKELQLAAEWAMTKIKGLCLDCLKDEGKWREDGVCVDDHRVSIW